MTLDSGQPIHDEAYAQAARDIAGNIAGGRFIAGQRWSQTWTRDSAYALDLGGGLGRPDVAKATLREKTSIDDQLGEVWHQDRCRHFGGWPNLTDSIVGAAGAWAVYLADGDTEFLRWAYRVTRNTLARAERDAYDPASGLFRGCASFMESNSAYPLRFHSDGEAVGQTKALSTNVLYFRGYALAARMAETLGESGDDGGAAARLREAINRRLWVPGRGLYAYFEYADGRLSSRMEGLGQALAVLWGVADDAQAASIFARTVTTPYGLPCLWPRYLAWTFATIDAYYYHNGMVWPFVQAYWALAAAGRGAAGVFGRELNRLAGLARRAPTFHEFYRPFSGRPDGSARQLWSAAGYVAMVNSGLFGIRVEPDRVRFAPVVPEGFGAIRLSGFAYRRMILDLEVIGPGNEVVSSTLDGQPLAAPVLPIDLAGQHTLRLTLR